MQEKFVILCCENIRPEVDAILATGAMPEASARSFSFHCGHVRSVWDTVKDQYYELDNVSARICLCGCGCTNTIDIPEDILNKPPLMLVDSGAPLFLPVALVDDFRRRGAYLILPGWLFRWKLNAKCDKLDQSTAREMFRESLNEVVLLDTGVHQGIAPVLAEYAEFTGLPARTLPVGLEHFRFRLDAQYEKWRRAQESAACKATVSAAEQRVADYSMVADLTGMIIGVHDENTVILKMLDHFVRLCSPKKVAFLPALEGTYGTVISIPPGAYTEEQGSPPFPVPEEQYQVTGTGDGFRVRVLYNKDLIGVLSVEEVSLPSALDEYLNLAHFIVQIAGLSITIARTHANLMLAMRTRENEIAERIRVELALRESEEKYRAIIDNIQDVFFRIDRENRVVMVSPSASRMFGVDSAAEMVGKPVVSLWKIPERRDAFLEAMRTGGGAVQDWETGFVRSDGTAFWVSISAHLHTDKYGNYAGTEGIIRDISERKKIEEALKGAIKKLNMLSSITRHDILNQIMGLRAYLELSREDLKGTKHETFIEKEDQAAEAIQRQIEFTKYYQDIGVNAPRWQDAEWVIREAATQLTPPGIEVRIAIAGIEIFADPLIIKVFFNLMENSLRHGERVTMMSFESRTSTASLILIYRDNGVGISEEDKEKLFRKGFGKHTGLGLFLSQEILAITGITITENGEPGKGVQFEITVPYGGYRYNS
ncbi:MAG: PAS domain S-box protein [Methanoregula sp.]|jgi:PAS domain S-box-containing protein|nr:PAS domain S-box protein [Methanoregula sp.]